MAHSKQEKNKSFNVTGLYQLPLLANYNKLNLLIYQCLLIYFFFIKLFGTSIELTFLIAK